MAEGEVDALDKRSLNETGEPGGLEAGAQVSQGAPEHSTFDMMEAASALDFLELTIKELCGNLPELARILAYPTTKVSGQCLEMVLEAFRGENR